MTKQSIQRALESRYGCFVNISQTAEFLGSKRETVRAKYLKDLDFLPNGRERLYFSADVAESIVNAKR